jgi:hypothetical protein
MGVEGGAPLRARRRLLVTLVDGRDTSAWRDRVYRPGTSLAVARSHCARAERSHSKRIDDSDYEILFEGLTNVLASSRIDAGSRESVAASAEKMTVNVVRGAANDKSVDANRLRGGGSLVGAAGAPEDGGVNAECTGANGERDDYIDECMRGNHKRASCSDKCMNVNREKVSCNAECGSANADRSDLNRDRAGGSPHSGSVNEECSGGTRNGGGVNAECVGGNAESADGTPGRMSGTRTKTSGTREKIRELILVNRDIEWRCAPPGDADRVPEQMSRVPGETSRVPEQMSRVPEETNWVPEQTNKVPHKTG